MHTVVLVLQARFDTCLLKYSCFPLPQLLGTFSQLGRSLELSLSYLLNVYLGDVSAYRSPCPASSGSPHRVPDAQEFVSNRAPQ